MTVTIDCTVKAAKRALPRNALSVNGTVIARDAVAREAQNHFANSPVEAWKAAARALVVRELLLQEARRIGVSAVPSEDGEARRETDEEAAMRTLIEQEVRTPEADAGTCQRYYQQNRSKFRTANLYEVRHILLPAAPGDKPARSDALIQANMIIAALKDDPDRFADWAKQASACPSREIGGSLGQIGPGQTVPEFERALDAIVPGAVHATPIETRYGFHIVWVDRRIDGRELPFEVVQARIADYLNETVRRQALRQYVKILAGRADIQGIEFDAAQSPLVN